MFTGIIEETGAVKSVNRHQTGARIEIDAAVILSDLEIGGSIAVNGCCLTAIEITSEGFAADLSPETMARTNLGDLEPGRRVNLERPLLPTSRLSGHFVQGHVDATGEFLEVAPAGDDNWTLRVRAPEETLKYLVYKGSVTIDGISLTVARLDGDVIEVAVIPHTYRETNLADRRPGDRVNLECDVLAKHIERLLSSVQLPSR
ncbi:MAG: riboflavin synthase [Acidobacteria bacterium]|nr:riboflavin synthase [Acidobacteriota bacterium]MDA1233709.1 riboflavin synthase [Acidobacteriota bacterium]